MKVWRWIFVCWLALVTVSIGLLTWVSNYHFRNFHVVEPGTLYRSGQLTPTGLDFVLQRYKIKTVVTLRAVSDPDRSTTEDLDLLEQQACENRGIKHIRIAPKVWDADERGDIAATQVVSEFQAIMDDKSNYPVLVHCFAGNHRTGALCGFFRMEYLHWPSSLAIAEMDALGFPPGQHRDAIEDYLKAYKPR